MVKSNRRKKCQKSQLLLLLNVLLEACAIGVAVFCTFFSNCVLGNEVAGPVFIFSLFIYSAFILDLIYFLLSRKLHTLVIDPLSIMFNFIMAGICILIGIGLISVLLFYCGYYAQFVLVIAGAFSVCSGIFHLMNAIMCNKALPNSERYYKHRHRRKGEKTQKIAKKRIKDLEKPQKAVKKSGQKDAKEVDKKDHNVDNRKPAKSNNKKGEKTGKPVAIHRQPSKTVCVVSMILYFICAVIEIIGYLCLLLYAFTLCVLGRENSTRVWWSMNCICPQMLPDLVFAVGGFFMVSHFHAPISAVYNIVMASLSILSGVLAFASVSGCGNPAQLLPILAGVIGLAAGGLHIMITRIVLKNLEGGGKLFQTRFSK